LCSGGLVGSKDAQAGNPPTVEQDDHSFAERRERGSAQRDAQQQAHHNAIRAPGYLAGESVEFACFLTRSSTVQRHFLYWYKGRGAPAYLLPPLACIFSNYKKQTLGGLENSDRAYSSFLFILGRQDPTSHPYWTGKARTAGDDDGRISQFSSKFEGFGGGLPGAEEEENFEAAPEKQKGPVKKSKEPVKRKK